MSRVLTGRALDPHINSQSLRGMFHLRHRVFFEQLGWEVRSRNGQERDGFDDLDPVYMLTGGQKGAVEGCWRLLPTTGDYMLEKIFPQLARGAEIPKDESIWEISRFAVLPSGSASRQQANLCSLTFDLLRAGVDFADRNGIRHYVFVTSVAVERLLKRVGLPLRRFGDGQAVRVGKVLSVACWIDIDDHTRQAVCGANAPAREAA
ncbi:acyl-homoserine-lactone synthase [Desulfuromonas versatilis]|uniref:acyl-homoserine-lactone synthase n=1 Tax=Desulfuromonas versatilis TaxID=2802975 RepID=A0ABN6DVG4_9BACT|nr:acyl-homoserine-lactone synthase [Desulfuromonas versatilis]BCR03757.1 acyl-homoserine-lactone synthase [Desulfuromonas versatilis]